ncbi:hypothetical protein QBZ16_001470 [Prototheca wickerhamii]|uniref:IPT/TIG domain-containing protein n=1 Tax=Prototheca wickerhamii TaxID=3111 RepID=A0AAD9IER4_PROWI|nr:hypothetical protein QBZ16_001470 [Prototheca wickerhamii]
MLSAPNSFQRDAAEGGEGGAARRGEGPDADDPAPVARPGDEEEELVARKLLKNMSIDENDAAIVYNESSGGAAGASARSGSRALSEEGSEGALSPEPRLAADARAKRAALRFHIIDFAPESAAVSGGDKMFVTGWVEKAGGDWEGAVHVKFGDVEVPATLVNPTVIKCTIPAVDAPRLAELCVTLGDGVPVSNVMSFEFLHVAAWRAGEGLAGGF